MVHSVEINDITNIKKQKVQSNWKSYDSVYVVLTAFESVVTRPTQLKIFKFEFHTVN